jgi:hypothetical protein
MGKPRNHIYPGQLRGKWRVLHEEPSLGRGVRWFCRCSCGTEKVVESWKLKTHPGGCVKCKSIKHGKHKSVEYKAWASAKNRCHNPKHRDFQNWGGRGIKMCKEWQESFQAFLNHVGPKPPKQCVLDRINNDKGYEPGNVRWVSYHVSNLNKRSPFPIPPWVPSAKKLREIGLSWEAISKELNLSKERPRRWVQRIYGKEYRAG